MAGKRSVLLVDDEPGIVMMVSKRLEVAGYAVTVAMDGEEALEKAQGGSHDLIVLDIMLPKVNGYEVCRRLKREERFKKVPIILFTAKTLERDEKLGIESGADAYIRKPYKAQELLDQIFALLGRTP